MLMGVSRLLQEAMRRSADRVSGYADMTLASLNEVYLVGTFIEAMGERGITIADVAHAEGNLTMAKIKLAEIEAIPVGRPLFFRKHITACRYSAIQSQEAVVRSWTAALDIADVPF